MASDYPPTPRTPYYKQRCEACGVASLYPREEMLLIAFAGRGDLARFEFLCHDCGGYIAQPACPEAISAYLKSRGNLRVDTLPRELFEPRPNLPISEDSPVDFAISLGLAELAGTLWTELGTPEATA